MESIISENKSLITYILGKQAVTDIHTLHTQVKATKTKSSDVHLRQKRKLGLLQQGLMRFSEWEPSRVAKSVDTASRNASLTTEHLFKTFRTMFEAETSLLSGGKATFEASDIDIANIVVIIYHQTLVDTARCVYENPKLLAGEGLEAKAVENAVLAIRKHYPHSHIVTVTPDVDKIAILENDVAVLRTELNNIKVAGLVSHIDHDNPFVASSPEEVPDPSVTSTPVSSPRKSAPGSLQSFAESPINTPREDDEASTPASSSPGSPVASPRMSSCEVPVSPPKDGVQEPPPIEEDEDPNDNNADSRSSPEEQDPLPEEDPIGPTEGSLGSPESPIGSEGNCNVDQEEEGINSPIPSSRGSYRGNQESPRASVGEDIGVDVVNVENPEVIITDPAVNMIEADEHDQDIHLSDNLIVSPPISPISTFSRKVVPRSGNGNGFRFF